MANCAGKGAWFHVSANHVSPFETAPKPVNEASVDKTTFGQTFPKLQGHNSLKPRASVFHQVNSALRTFVKRMWSFGRWSFANASIKILLNVLAPNIALAAKAMCPVKTWSPLFVHFFLKKFVLRAIQDDVIYLLAVLCMVSCNQ